MGLGLIALSGNASTLTFNGLASAERKSEGWIYAVKAQAVYGRSRLPATETEVERTEVVALGANADVRVDRRFTPVISGYVLAGAQTDHMKSVEVRGTGEAGSRHLLVGREEPGRASSRRCARTWPSATSASRASSTTRRGWTWRTWTWAARAWASLFSYGLSKDTVFTEEAEAIPNVLGDARLLVNSTSQAHGGADGQPLGGHQLRPPVRQLAAAGEGLHGHGAGGQRPGVLLSPRGPRPQTPRGAGENPRRRARDFSRVRGA